MTRIHKLALAAAVALGTASAAAHAGDYIRQQVSVSYSDLDVSTATGATALLARIDMAAVKACGGKPFFQPLYSSIPDAVTREYLTCHARAVSDAVASVGSPVLTRIYAQNGEASQHFAGR